MFDGISYLIYNSLRLFEKESVVTAAISNEFLPLLGLMAHRLSQGIGAEIQRVCKTSGWIPDRPGVDYFEIRKQFARKKLSCLVDAGYSNHVISVADCEVIRVTSTIPRHYHPEAASVARVVSYQRATPLQSSLLGLCDAKETKVSIDVGQTFSFPPGVVHGFEGHPRYPLYLIAVSYPSLGESGTKFI